MDSSLPIKNTDKPLTLEMDVKDGNPLLPPELYTHIFSFLERRELFAASGVCGLFRQLLIENEQLRLKQFLRCISDQLPPEKQDEVLSDAIGKAQSLRVLIETVNQGIRILAKTILVFNDEQFKSVRLSALELTQRGIVQTGHLFRLTGAYRQNNNQEKVRLLSLHGDVHQAIEQVNRNHDHHADDRLYITIGCLMEGEYQRAFLAQRGASTLNQLVTIQGALALNRIYYQAVVERKDPSEALRDKRALVNKQNQANLSDNFGLMKEVIPESFFERVRERNQLAEAYIAKMTDAPKEEGDQAGSSQSHSAEEGASLHHLVDGDYDRAMLALPLSSNDLSDLIHILQALIAIGRILSNLGDEGGLSRAIEDAKLQNIVALTASIKKMRASIPESLIEQLYERIDLATTVCLENKNLQHAYAVAVMLPDVFGEREIPLEKVILYCLKNGNDNWINHCLGELPKGRNFAVRDRTARIYFERGDFSRSYKYAPHGGETRQMLIEKSEEQLDEVLALVKENNLEAAKESLKKVPLFSKKYGEVFAEYYLKLESRDGEQLFEDVVIIPDDMYLEECRKIVGASLLEAGQLERGVTFFEEAMAFRNIPYEYERELLSRYIQILNEKDRFDLLKRVVLSTANKCFFQESSVFDELVTNIGEERTLELFFQQPTPEMTVTFMDFLCVKIHYKQFDNVVQLLNKLDPNTQSHLRTSVANHHIRNILSECTQKSHSLYLLELARIFQNQSLSIGVLERANLTKYHKQAYVIANTLAEPDKSQYFKKIFQACMAEGAYKNARELLLKLPKGPLRDQQVMEFLTHRTLRFEEAPLKELIDLFEDKTNLRKLYQNYKQIKLESQAAVVSSMIDWTVAEQLFNKIQGAFNRQT